MSTVTQRRIIYLAACGFLITTIAVLYFGLTNSQPKPVTTGIPSAEPILAENEISKPPNNLLDVSSVRLQRPLYDPPKPKPVAAKVIPKTVTQPKVVRQTRPRVELVLLGTVIETGKSLAILADASGTIDQKSTGDTLELQPAGLVLESIQSDKVVVSHAGQQLTFSVQSETQQADGFKTERKRDRQKSKRSRF